MIKIDKNVPPPMSKAIGLALDTMQVGDSFLIEEDTFQMRQTLFRKARELKDKGKVFTSMAEEDGIRTWRMA